MVSYLVQFHYPIFTLFSLSLLGNSTIANVYYFTVNWQYTSQVVQKRTSSNTYITIIFYIYRTKKNYLVRVQFTLWKH